MIHAIAALPLLAAAIPQDSDALASSVRAAADTEVRIATYDVGDLTGATELRELRDSVVRDDIPATVRRAALDRYVELLDTGAVEAVTDELVETIRAFVEPKLAGDLERVIATAPGEITVSGREQQQAWVEAFLRQTRAFDGMIEFRMRIYEVPDGALAALVDGRSGTVLAADAVALFQERIESLEGASTLMVPRVLTRCATLANIQLVEQTAYIKDFEITVLPDLHQEIADPIIDVLQTGIDVDVRGIPSAGGGLDVHAEFRYSTADKPIRAEKVRIGAAGHEVTVQLPEVRMARASARFELAPGAAVVMATVDPGREEGEAPRDLVFLMQALRVGPEDVGDAMDAPIDPAPDADPRKGGR
ncbi:MAG: hypothetical protein AAFZ87_16570 [Planctomycetota bacterium]